MTVKGYTTTSPTLKARFAVYARYHLLGLALGLPAGYHAQVHFKNSPQAHLAADCFNKKAKSLGTAVKTLREGNIPLPGAPVCTPREEQSMDHFKYMLGLGTASAGLMMFGALRALTLNKIKR